LLGGDLVRQRLTYSGSREAFEKALKMLRPKEALEFKRRFALWPQMLKNLVFARALYELKVNCYRFVGLYELEESESFDRAALVGD
jgi:hypothetical protein